MTPADLLRDVNAARVRPSSDRVADCDTILAIVVDDALGYHAHVREVPANADRLMLRWEYRRWNRTGSDGVVSYYFLLASLDERHVKAIIDLVHIAIQYERIVLGPPVLLES